MKARKNLAFFLGFMIAFLPPLHSQEKEKIIITNPFQTSSTAIVLEINPLPKFTFSLNKTLRIRKTDKAEMYNYKPKKPDKSYRHLVLFLELLEQETKTKLPKVDIVVVTAKEFLDIVEVDGIVWTEPLMDLSAKLKASGLIWFVEEDAFKIFVVNFKNPVRVLLLEQFLAHLTLLTEWESSVRSVSPEDTEVLLDKRKEEWKKQEGRAYTLFHRVSGHWKLLQLNWPPAPFQRLKVLSIPLPWPPWPLPRNRK